MGPETAAGLVFGSGMLFHQLVAGGLPGVALALFLNTLNAKVLRDRTELFLLHLFTVHFTVACLSGIVLETGLELHWPGLQDSVIRLVGHPVGRSAAMAFLLISFLLWQLMGQRSQSFRMGATFMLFISTFMLSGWSVVVNNWMHNPEVVLLQEVGDIGFGLELGALWEMTINVYGLTRLAHNYLASVMIGVLWVLLAVSVGKMLGAEDSSDDWSRIRRWLLGVVVVVIGLQPLTGHLQFSNVVEVQPAKAAAIEGYYGQYGEAFRIYPLGSTDPDRRVTSGFALPEWLSDRLLNSVDVEIKPLAHEPHETWPPVRRVFYAFRTMVLCWCLLTASIAVLLILNLKARTAMIVTATALLAALTAALAGWVTSESGRLPWAINEVITVAQAVSPELHCSDVLRALFSNVVFHLLLIVCWVSVQLNLVRDHFSTDAHV
jgi:cytochrome d ubiquinol oxidase subunit I